MNRNRIRICGRNTSTLPTPAITPSAMKLCSRPGRHRADRSRRARRSPIEIKSIGGCAQVNTAWNITNSTAAGSARPPTGCSSTASIRAVESIGCSGRVTRRREDAVGLALRRAQLRGARRRASRFAAGAACAAGRDLDRSAQQIGDPAACAPRPSGRPARRARRDSRAQVDAPCRDDARCRACSAPGPSAGRRAFNSSTRRRDSRRLVASATQTTRSGDGLVGETAEHDVARDLLVGAAGAQRIGAGQIDQR